MTCPPCAYVRWRQILQAWDTAADGAARRAVLPVLRRQTAMTAVTGGGEQGQEDEPVLHCCRSVRLPEPADPTRALFPTVHKTGAIGARAMTGHGIDEMIQRRAAAAGFTAAQVDKLGGHSLRAGFVTEAFRAGADACDHAADRAPLPGDARGLRPGTRPPGRQRRHPPRPLTDERHQHCR